MSDWSSQESKQIYNIDQWSEGYVDADAQGHLLIRPYRDAKRGEIDLKELLNDIRGQDISLPVLIRFQDILRDRIDQLSSAFSSAFKKYNYQASYTAVYPIKVNQQFSVASEIISHGNSRVGLEAGSKPELMAVLSLAQPGENVIICNGYKDREYIRIALIAQRLGFRIYIVLEKTSELPLVLEEAANLQVEPTLGLRLRLASIGKGKWQNTGGEKAKFGLSAEQILWVIRTLEDAGKKQWIQLLHFHMGSQIASLDDIRTGLAEASQYFVELHRKGIQIQVLDIGGGIGVDYEGTDSKAEFSVNYELPDYADSVVQQFSRVCAEHEIPHPSVITEAGRAMTAHHAVLVTNVVNTEYHPEDVLPREGDDNALLQQCWQLYEQALNAEPTTVYEQIGNVFRYAQQQFTQGNFNIEQRAALDAIYLASCARLKKNLSHHIPEQHALLNELNEKLADKVVCNLSIFQSIPDVWGISQIFPIVPLQRLNEQPDRRVILQDLTCDSDGQIEQYVDRYGVETSLPLHRIDNEQEYLLGIFMVGAYQEILGDMHNLFGDTNTINVELNDNGGYELFGAETGDTVLELLNYVHFETGEMLKSYKAKVQAANLDHAASAQFLSELEAGLEGYTYLED